MANYYHGRGLMEIRQSSNPFFKTVNSDIGSSVNSNVNESFQWKHDPNPALLIPSNEKDGSFPFLFARTSDLIGSHVQVPSDPTSSNKKNIYSKTEFLKKRREDLLLTIDEMNLKALSESYNIKKNKVVKVDTADKLKCYKHEPIKEHPLYTRSSVSTVCTAKALYYMINVFLLRVKLGENHLLLLHSFLRGLHLAKILLDLLTILNLNIQLSIQAYQDPMYILL